MTRDAQVDFASLLKKIRKARGLTQEGLARELEVTFGTVNGWENRKHTPIRAFATRLLAMAAEAGVAPRKASQPPRRRRTGS